MTSSKIKINDCLTKFLHDVNNPVLKGFCKFQVDIPKNATVTAVQSLENSIHLYCSSYVGRQKSAYQPIFPYNITENSLTSLVHNSVFISPSKFKFGTETRCMVL